MLSETGTLVMGSYCISFEEQRQRLQERVDDPTKHWKFSLGDLKCANSGSTKRRTKRCWAPPARPGPLDGGAGRLKTHRNLMIATLVRDRLQSLACATRPKTWRSRA